MNYLQIIFVTALLVIRADTTSLISDYEVSPNMNSSYKDMGPSKADQYSKTNQLQQMLLQSN